jgi:hypothetical protein
MRKFTKLWQLMIILLLSSSIGFAQTVITPQAKQDQSKQSSERFVTPNQNQFLKDQELKKLDKGNDVPIEKMMEASKGAEDVNPYPEIYQNPEETMQTATKSQGELTLTPVKPLLGKPEVSSTKAVLYSQMVTGANGGASQNFATIDDIYDCSAADDFTITTGPWNVRKISWYGSYSTGGGPISAYNIEFFANNAGVPGASIQSYPLTIATQSGAVSPFLFTAYLPANLDLAAGTYWISIQADADFAVSGQFYWTCHNPATTFPAEGVWQNPLDGFATGQTTWGPMSNIFAGFYDFTFELGDDPPPACAAPSSMVAANYTTTSAGLNWTENGTATMWDLEWGLDGFTLGTGTPVNVASKPYTLGGLTTGVDYDIYYRSDCGATQSSWVGPFNLRLPDYFASITPTTTCQTNSGLWNANGGKAWYTVSVTGGFMYNFSICSVDVTCGGTCTTLGDGDFTMYGPDGWAQQFYIDGNSLCSWNATTYGSAYQNWTAPTTGTYYLMVDDFYGTNSGTFTLGYIRYVPPACPQPVSPTTTSITGNSAIIDWTEAGSATTWEYAYGVSPYSPPTSGTSTTTKPITLSGLTGGTPYQWYVRAVCSPLSASAWTGPQNFTTLVPVPELLYQYDKIETLTADVTLLAPEYFGGYLWVMGAKGAVAGNPKYIYQYDYTNGTLINSYLQGTTTTWGMRDMANNGTFIYAGDENGFYQINPATGAVTTLFTNTAPIIPLVTVTRALAFDGTKFWTKNFGGSVYAFDFSGNVVAGPFANTASAYGAAYDPTVPCIWWHATGGSTGNQMVQMLLTGVFTGVTKPVPVHPCGPAAGSVGGAFMDFGSMYPGKNVFGVLSQSTPDVVKIFEAYDSGYPEQTSNHVPLCGATGVAVAGNLTWNFGASTTTYDLKFGVAGAMSTVVSNQAAGATGSYAYAGLSPATTYEWQVIAKNATGNTNGLIYKFTTACGIYAPPYTQDFATYLGVAPPPVCWQEADAGDPTTGPQTPGTSVWTYDIFGNTGTNNCAKVNMYSNTMRDWLISPHFNLSGGTYQVLFDVALTTWNATTPITMGSDDQMIFLISPDGGTTWTALKTYNASTPVSNTGETAVVSLAGYNQTDVVFAFWANEGTVDDAPDYDFFVDNFILQLPPACPAPTTLTATSVTSNSANIGWTSSATAWEYQVGLAGFTPGATGIPTALNPTPISGLSSSTSYDFYVRANCGGTYSGWAGPKNFITTPVNDNCLNAQAIAGPYPVTGVAGTTVGATQDCPALLTIATGEVWYAIDLPNTYNYITITEHGTATFNNGYIVGTTVQCSCDQLDYYFDPNYSFVLPNLTLHFAGVPGPGTFYYPAATGVQGTFTLDVDVDQMFEVSGTLAYYSSALPIDFSKVLVYDDSKAYLGEVPTDAAGDYAFIAVAGNYNLTGQTYKPRGGTNILDAINTRQFLGGSYAMNALQQRAANVNNNIGVDILDAIFMQQSLSGPKPAGWTAPDWLFENPAFALASDLVVDIDALCSGDPNGSYTVPSGVFLAPGTNCATPITVTLPAALPYANTNTTCGMLDDYNATTLMGSYDGGEDIIYQLVVTSAISINITLDPGLTTWTGWGLFNGCPDLNVGIIGSNNSGSGAHGKTNIPLTPGTYYLMIDTWPDPTCIPSFNLTISVYTPPPAITLPYDQGFESATLPATWTVTDVLGTAGNWATYVGTRYPSGNAAHGGTYVAYFNSYSASTGNNTRLESYDVNLAANPDAQVNFWMFHDPGYSTSNDRIQIQVFTGGVWVDVGTPISRYAAVAGWTQHIVDISAYVGGTVKIGFLGISEYGNDCHIDDVRFEEVP